MGDNTPEGFGAQQVFQAASRIDRDLLAAHREIADAIASHLDNSMIDPEMALGRPLEPGEDFPDPELRHSHQPFTFVDEHMEDFQTLQLLALDVYTSYAGVAQELRLFASYRAQHLDTIPEVVEEVQERILPRLILARMSLRRFLGLPRGPHSANEEAFWINDLTD